MTEIEPSTIKEIKEGLIDLESSPMCKVEEYKGVNSSSSDGTSPGISV
jgi:hypothetical protein